MDKQDSSPSADGGNAFSADIELVVADGRTTTRITAELSLERGVLVLFGRSGTGKSLTVKALAGLVTPKRGRVVVRGKALFDSEARVDVPPHRRRVGYVPQHQGLFPFATVAENVAFGLPRAERRQGGPRVAELLRSLELEPLAGALPASLSGGERQRVAIARALAVSPELLLLDEPLSSIDVEGKRELRTKLREAIDAFATPTVLVTHDPEDALALGDVVVRYEKGRTVGSGPPGELLADVLSRR